MKDKKFVVLLALVVGWLLLFFGAASGELKINANVERLSTAIVVVWFAYWTFSTIRWAKRPEPPTEQKDANAPKTEDPKS